MNSFTYEIPNEDGFFNAVMTVLCNDPKYSNKRRTDMNTLNIS